MRAHWDEVSDARQSHLVAQGSLPPADGWTGPVPLLAHRDCPSCGKHQPHAHAHILDYLSRGAYDLRKTRGDRVYTRAVLLHHLGYIVPWEQYPSWVINALDPEHARLWPL